MPRKVPPLSAMFPVKNCSDVGAEDKTVPAPNIISPCWAAAKWQERKRPKMGAKSANFLKTNLQLKIRVTRFV
jgi:hypothetical protein